MVLISIHNLCLLCFHLGGQGKQLDSGFGESTKMGNTIPKR